MIDVLKWLEAKLSRHSPAVDADERQSVGGVQSHEPGQDVPMPDIYACEDTVTQQNLESLDESSANHNESTEPGESTGGDPYKTS